MSSTTASRTQSLARIALSIAIITVSAWVTIPIGPVPFTLQCFAVALAICVLPALESLYAVGGYLLLGAFGVPVFSGMRGGFSVLAGVTGGFLWGYFIAVAVSLLVLKLFERLGQNRTLVACICASLVYLLIAYLCGTVQYMAVAGASLPAALATCVIPFVPVDLIKIVAASVVAVAVQRALGLNTAPKRA